MVFTNQLTIDQWRYQSVAQQKGEATMLRWAIVFLIIALLAGALGLFHVEWLASEIAWILFVVFIILFIVSLVLGRPGPPAT
jgi:uncharacterized membrane protein YtjA (UPF0391 family)